MWLFIHARATSGKRTNSMDGSPPGIFHVADPGINVTGDEIATINKHDLYENPANWSYKRYLLFLVASIWI